MNRFAKTIATVAAVVLLASAGALLSGRGAAEADAQSRSYTKCTTVVDGYWAYVEVRLTEPGVGETATQHRDRIISACEGDVRGNVLARSNIPGGLPKPRVSWTGRFSSETRTRAAGFPIYSFYYDNADSVSPQAGFTNELPYGSPVAGQPITAYHCGPGFCTATRLDFVLPAARTNSDTGFDVIAEFTTTAGVVKHRVVRDFIRLSDGTPLLEHAKGYYREWLDSAGNWQRSGSYGPDEDAKRRATENARRVSEDMDPRVEEPPPPADCGLPPNWHPLIPLPAGCDAWDR